MSEAKWRVALLIFNGAWASTVYGSLELFHSVNLRQPKDKQFQCDLISTDSQPIQLYGGQTIQSDTTISDAPYDLIMLALIGATFSTLLSNILPFRHGL